MLHNWFFLEEDALYIGLVEMGIIPKWSLMIITPAVFFLAVLLVYAVVVPIQRASEKKLAAKKAEAESNAEEPEAEKTEE